MNSSVPDPADPAVTRLKALLARPRTDLGWRFEIGRALAALRRDGQADARPVRVVAGLARMSRVQAHHHLRFADLFNREDVEGLKLAWTSVVAVMAIDDTAERLELLRDAATEGWSKARIQREVRLRRPAPGRPGIRRRRVTSDLAELWRLADAVTDFVERYRLWAKQVPLEDQVRLIREFIDGVNEEVAGRRLDRLGEAERVFGAVPGVSGLLVRAIRTARRRTVG
jgi:hypothetical protein